MRRRFVPHQLWHAHAIELAHEGVPLNVIQRQLGNRNLGVTSIYLQGIAPDEIIETVRPPMIPARAGLLPRFSERNFSSPLLEDAGFDVLGQAGDGDELLRKVRAHRPDVAIIDIRMPPTQLDEGLQAARAIRAQHPEIGVLLLSQHVEERYATELLEHAAGGVGYLLKDRLTDTARLADAIRLIASGGTVLDPAVVTHMLGRNRRNHALDALTERDLEVLSHMAAGASNHAIAQHMYLSKRAIERHVTTIFDKLGITASRHDHRRVLAVLAYLRAA